jgi:hypothetical protein
MRNALNRAAASALLLLIVISVPTAGISQTRGTTAQAKAAPFGNVEAISAKQLRDYLTFIASDELEGRDTPSRGLDIAAKYIAEHLSSWGLKPGGGDGTYFQKVPLRLNKMDPTGTRLELNGQNYTYGHDFLASFSPASFAQAPLVFVGNGWVIKSKNIDPYQGIDVKDKVVIVVNSLPKGVTFADLKGPVGGDWSSPPFYAQTHGAKAVIAFSTYSGLANWEATRWGQAEQGVVAFGPQQSQITVPTFTVSPRVLSALFQGEKFSSTVLFNRSITGEAFESFDLKPEKRVSGSVALKSENIHTQNVVGILEGSDPLLKNEYVAVGAHYDHVGMNPFATGDQIWNGADDDGSGTVAVMAIAKAMAEGPRPKRSFLFIWHAGEEKGLWGSEYFTDNPTVPITSIITELNIDMIGRYQNPGDENHPRNKELPKPNEIFTIGNRMMSTELGQIADDVNNSLLKLNFNPKYADPNDPNRFFYRSDHYNYARKGIPIIFFMDGDHADYHQPSDSIEKINFEQMEKVTKTIFATGWELANRATRPKVDKPLPATVGAN